MALRWIHKGLGVALKEGIKFKFYEIIGGLI